MATKQQLEMEGQEKEASKVKEGSLRAGRGWSPVQQKNREVQREQPGLGTALGHLLFPVCRARFQSQWFLFQERTGEPY